MLATPQLQQDPPPVLAEEGPYAAALSSSRLSASSPDSCLPQCPAGEVPEEGTASLGQLFLAGGCGVKGDIQTFLGKLAASPQVRWEEAKLQHAHATRRTRRPRRPKDDARAPPQPLPPPCPTFDVAALDHQQADRASDATVGEDGILIRLSSGSEGSCKRTCSLVGGDASWQEMKPSLAGMAPPSKRVRASMSAIVPSPPPTRRFSAPSPTDDQIAPESLLHHSLSHTTGLSARSASSPELAGSSGPCAGCVCGGFPQFPFAYGAALYGQGGAHVCGAEVRVSEHESVSRSDRLAVDRLIYDIGDYCLSLCSDISLLCASATQQQTTDSFTSPSSASPVGEHYWGRYSNGRGSRTRLDDGPLSARWPQQPTDPGRPPAAANDGAYPCDPSREAFSLGVSVPSPPAFQMMPSTRNEPPLRPPSIDPGSTGPPCRSSARAYAFQHGTGRQEGFVQFEEREG